MRVDERGTNSQEPKLPPELSARDFKVPLTHALALWLEKWGPLVILGMAGVVLVIGYFWLR